MDHNVLCTELRNLGVHNVLITWIGSFLTNRSQSINISSAMISGHVLPRGGIPQGTKLAPLLFAVLVNNLARQWKITAKYVDDLSVVGVPPVFCRSLQEIFAFMLVSMACASTQ